MLGLKVATGRRAFQPLWERLHELSLRGMNIGAGDAIAASGEAHVLDRLAKRTTGRERAVVFDVGANVGAYAETVLTRLGARAALYCFEPSPSAYVRLERALAHRDAVRLFNVGLGAAEETVTLYADEAGSPLGSVFARKLDHLGITLDRREEVRLRRLDDVAREEGVSRIDLLKLDVEGNELRALEGAADLLARGAVELIQFEFGGTNIDSRTYLRDFYDLLTPTHRLFRILWDGLAPIDRYRERFEVFETTNYLAVRR